MRAAFIPPGPRAMFRAMPTIAAGQHEIKVQLHNTDHTPLQPEVTDSVMVTFP